MKEKSKRKVDKSTYFSDYLVVQTNESMPITVFVQSTSALSLGINLRNNLSQIIQSGVAKTLEDVNIAFTTQGF